MRKPLIADLQLESLPAEVQEIAAELLCTISDAATWQHPGAIARLETLARFSESRSKDPYHLDRPLVRAFLKSLPGLGQEQSEVGRAKAKAEKTKRTATPEELERAAELDRGADVRMLIGALGCLDLAFTKLEPAFVQRALRAYSGHELAARLTVECGAFGEATQWPSRPAKEDAVARVVKLSMRSTSEPSRKKEHTRKKPKAAQKK